MKVASEFFTRSKRPIPKTCFVLMPFEEGMNAVYEHGIKPLVEGIGIQCRRADELYSAQGILGDIWESIQSAEIIIADLTNKNPNVMYELGLCHALWKHVVLISQNKNDVPFDLRAWRVIWYDFTFAGAARLKEELQRAIEALRSEPLLESQLVPMQEQNQVTVEPPHEDTAPQWLKGEISSWNPQRRYGFVTAQSESFYFNIDYMFVRETEPSIGKIVTFTPLSALPETNNRRASKVLIHGAYLKGVVTHIVRNKGYCFVEISDQHSERHSLFVLCADGEIPEVGSEIWFEIGDNQQGPIGRYNTFTSTKGDTERSRNKS